MKATNMKISNKKQLQSLYKIMKTEIDDLLDVLWIDDEIDDREYDPQRITELLKIQDHTLNTREKVALASAGGVLRACQSALSKLKFPMRIRNKMFEKNIGEYKVMFERLSEG